uniref:Uncharacterized protein n=1 Tax=Candidatus Kentrum sp. FM TaxID=2126340 RepID=A0A450WVZ3_9GAMM|nr:MAG: hypothetical protein BECKFM1743B_GA0114221_107612 [Candidatus Kentron sp. FM]
MRLGCAVLLSGHFLFFMYTFRAAISIRYWFAIDIAIRYRYRFYRAFSIASSDIDSDPERTTTPVAARLRCASVRSLARIDSPEYRRMARAGNGRHIPRQTIQSPFREPGKGHGLYPVRIDAMGGGGIHEAVGQLFPKTLE